MALAVLLLLSVIPTCLLGADWGNPGGRRVRRQLEEGCTTTGYEKRVRELCEEEFEEICKTVTNVEYKKEIITRCDTRLEQRCNTTTRAVPKEVCVQRNRTECFPDYRIVTETTFTSECENIVQHICEEHYHVPVPVPVPVPHHHPHPPHVPFGPAPNPNGRKRRRRKKRSSIMKRKKRASSLERDQLILGLKQALGVPAPPPLLFHQELPAPPGCRSLVTQKCHKVPVELVKKVPADQCEEVPGVKCFFELVDVEHPVCHEVPVEECIDELQETPFLVDTEKCEDVPKIVCTEIEEQVPIQVCKTIDKQRTPIVVGKGSTRKVNSIKGIGVRAKVVGRLPDIGDVGGDRKARLQVEGSEVPDSTQLRLKETLKPEVLERLRSQIFDTNPEDFKKKSKDGRNKRGQKGPRGQLQSQKTRMRRILKKFISESLRRSSSSR